MSEWSTKKPPPCNKLFRIHYKDRDPGSPIFTVIKRACDEEHALDKFTDPDDLDWEVLKIERVKKDRG